MPPPGWPLCVLGHSVAPVMLPCAQPGSVSACLDIAAVWLESHSWASFIKCRCAQRGDRFWRRGVGNSWLWVLSGSLYQGSSTYAQWAKLCRCFSPCLTVTLAMMQVYFKSIFKTQCIIAFAWHRSSEPFHVWCASSPVSRTTYISFYHSPCNNVLQWPHYETGTDLNSRARDS